MSASTGPAVPLIPNVTSTLKGRSEYSPPYINPAPLNYRYTHLRVSMIAGSTTTRQSFPNMPNIPSSGCFCTAPQSTNSAAHRTTSKIRSTRKPPSPCPTNIITMPHAPRKTTISKLPDEIILEILKYLGPRELLPCQLVSQRWRSIAADPTLWKFYCRAFQYWDSTHRFHDALHRNPPNFDWKALAVKRVEANLEIARLFNLILSSQQDRGEQIYKICSYGNDAKDFLLAQCRTPDHHPQVLCRRWYGNYILNSLHRTLAIKEWQEVAYKESLNLQLDHRQQTPDQQQQQQQQLRQNCQGTRLERMFGTFDLFFAQQEECDLDAITGKLDAMAEEFVRQHPICMHQQSIRTRAVLLLKWLNCRCGTTSTPFSDLPDISRLLLGRTLLYGPHDTLSAINSVIYVALARRLAMPAWLVSGLSILVRVSTNYVQGFSWSETQSQDGNDVFYVWPGRSCQEFSKNRLPIASLPLGERNLLPVADETAAFGLIRQVVERRHMSRPIDGLPTNMYSGSTPPRTHDEISSLTKYMQIWARAIFLLPDDIGWRDSMHSLLDMLPHFPEDVWVVEDHIGHLLSRVDLSQPFTRNNVKAILGELELLKRRDASPAISNFRNMVGGSGAPGTPALDPPLRVGDVIRHKRYDYVSVITGWRVDFSRELTKEEMENSVVLFTYVCLRPMDNPTPSPVIFLRPNSVKRVRDPSAIPAELFHRAGQFFKRFDSSKCRFVSNIHEQYPQH